MNEEEKEAIEKFKKLKDYKQTFYGNTWFKVEVCADDEMKQNVDTILNLIKKQQKEIEELKKKNEPQPDCAEPVERTEKMVNMKWVNHNYISKDKIEKKMRGEINKSWRNTEQRKCQLYAYDILKELLEG